MVITRVDDWSNVRHKLVLLLTLREAEVTLLGSLIIHDSLELAVLLGALLTLLVAIARAETELTAAHRQLDGHFLHTNNGRIAIASSLLLASVVHHLALGVALLIDIHSLHLVTHNDILLASLVADLLGDEALTEASTTAISNLELANGLHNVITDESVVGATRSEAEFLNEGALLIAVLGSILAHRDTLLITLLALLLALEALGIELLTNTLVVLGFNGLLSTGLDTAGDKFVAALRQTVAFETSLAAITAHRANTVTAANAISRVELAAATALR